jgi:hypothetical protein
VEDVLWISRHVDLLGDPRLGAEQQERFLPTRFDLDGNALDAKGFACHELACPRCYLHVPRAMLESDSIFISILGTPGCGKSFFLTAMTWGLKSVLPEHFALAFADADPRSNVRLHEYEELLFLNPRMDTAIPLADLIRKTELQGDLYDSVVFGNQTVNYPRPFMFSLQAQPGHPKYATERRLSRLLCLYDNAGEHFQPGQDSTGSPVTEHLACSRLLMFLFDPTQDVRFRTLCLGTGKNESVGKTSRQESVLHESAVRIRKRVTLAHDAKHQRPLIIVVTKADLWSHHLGQTKWQHPWKSKELVAGLDLDMVDGVSRRLRELMLGCSPEFVDAAENFAESVVYIPVSALGSMPVVQPETGRLAIRPRDIQPLWETVPLLYGLCRWVPGIIPSLRRSHGNLTMHRNP